MSLLWTLFNTEDHNELGKQRVSRKEIMDFYVHEDEGVKNLYVGQWLIKKKKNNLPHQKDNIKT